MLYTVGLISTQEKEEEDYIQWFKGEKQELEVEDAVEEAKDVVSREQMPVCGEWQWLYL